MTTPADHPAMRIPETVTDHRPSDAISGRWRLDPSRSRVEFRVRHLWGLSTVRRHFDDYHGQLDLSAYPALELTIEAASVQTGNRRRDRHLRSAAFFDAEHHPWVQFRADSLAQRHGTPTPRAWDGLQPAGDDLAAYRVVHRGIPDHELSGATLARSSRNQLARRGGHVRVATNAGLPARLDSEKSRECSASGTAGTPSAATCTSSAATSLPPPVASRSRPATRAAADAARRSPLRGVVRGPCWRPTHQPKRRSALREFERAHVHKAEPLVQCSAALATGLDVCR